MIDGGTDGSPESRHANLSEPVNTHVGVDTYEVVDAPGLVSDRQFPDLRNLHESSPIYLRLSSRDLVEAVLTLRLPVGECSVITSKLGRPAMWVNGTAFGNIHVDVNS